ncbi:MAG: glycosyltransferase family 39 protein [Bryobacteraceae bacterium]|nr:glycosyltransferase family 39 protein [Bryobacteraceae bacterium]
MERSAQYAMPVIYAAALGLLVEWPELWLDEVLQLVGTLDRDPGELMAWVRRNPGAAPLGYVAQWVVLEIAGFSHFAARLPSLLASAAAGAAMFRLARQAGVQQPQAAVALFLLLPIQLHYAIEARPYAQSLLWGVLATLFFLKDRPWAYGLSLLAGLYTQPFVFLIAPAHAGWAWFHDRRKFWRMGAAAAAAGVLFAPWYLYARSYWQESIGESGFRFTVDWRSPLLLFREISGASYYGSALLLILAVLGMRRLPAPAGRFLLAGIGVPVVLALAADAMFSYFVAIRQFLWIVPSIVLLAAAGLEELSPKWRRAALAGLLLVFLWYDARFWTRPRGENWELATAELTRLVGQAECVVFEPADIHLVYGVFDRELRKRSCGPLEGRRRVIHAISPYGRERDIGRVVEQSEAGGSRFRVVEVGGR